MQIWEDPARIRVLQEFLTCWGAPNTCFKLTSEEFMLSYIDMKIRLLRLNFHRKGELGFSRKNLNEF